MRKRNVLWCFERTQKFNIEDRWVKFWNVYAIAVWKRIIVSFLEIVQCNTPTFWSYQNYIISHYRLNYWSCFFKKNLFSVSNIHESQDSRWKGRDFLNLSLPLPIVSQASIIIESSPLRIASDRTRTGNPWFPSC